MITYQTLEDGSFRTEKITHIPVGSARHEKALEDIRSGFSRVASYVEPPVDLSMERDKSLESLTYEVSPGKEISTKPEDAQIIKNAIDVMARKNIQTIEWELTDDSVIDITANELKAALEYSQDQAFEIRKEYKTKKKERQSKSDREQLNNILGRKVNV